MKRELPESYIKYFAYIRKSTESEERQALSIPAQKDKVAELFPNLDVEFIVESKSAFKPYNRPEFKKMVDRIMAGERQGLIAWHPDRLSRNEIDAATLTYMIRKTELKDLKFGSYNFDNSPEGIWMLQMALSQSQYSSAKLGKDVKRGLEKKLRMGWYSSRAPLGYLNTIHLEKGENIIINDKERYDIVKQMWQMLLTGNYTVMQILDVANNQLKLKTRTTKHYIGKPMCKAAIYRLFTNRFYCGYFENPKGSGKWYRGKHEPMITEGEFERAQEILGRKGKPKPQKREFAFTGLMKCGSCGAMITAEVKTKRQKNGNVHTYVLYHCTKRINKDCPERSVRLETLMAQIDTLASGLTISDKFGDWAIKYLHEIREGEASSQEQVLSNKQKQLAAIDRQLSNLLLKFTSGGNLQNELISDEQYKTLKNQLVKDKDALETELKTYGKEKEQWLELSERTFNFARYAKYWFEKGDLMTKRAIFACLGSNLSIKDQSMALDMRPTFKFIFDNVKEAEKEFISVRTNEKGPVKGQFLTIHPEILTGRRR